MTQRSILITGCSSGIGYDAAHGLRADGWRVFASCRQQKDCARLQDEGFDSPLIDYNDSNTILHGLAEVLEATGGTLDALYNNAAIGVPSMVEDLPRDALRATFEANLFGLHELTRYVIPVMRAQGHGRIVNCSSVLGLVAMRWRGAYIASKFALEGLTDALRLEMGNTPIKVVLIEPGQITSEFRNNSLANFEHWIDVDGSAHRDEYIALRRRFQKKTGLDPFELPPSAVTRKLSKALNSKNPKPRYYVTKPAYAMSVLRHVCTTRMLDRILKRV